MGNWARQVHEQATHLFCCRVQELLRWPIGAVEHLVVAARVVLVLLVLR